jgi:diadenosine tetraphosphate (Ap4A) HIT family hydrolase
MSCVLCDNPSSTGTTVYEDDHALVILHNDWAVRGHAMVVAREHVENISDLADPLQFFSVYARAERALLDATGCERAMILKLGIVTPHLHLHIYPMNANDDRAAVFRAFDSASGEEPSPAFIEEVRRRLHE